MDANALAQRLLNARATATALPLNDWTDGPQTMEDGYAIQAAGARILTEGQGWTHIGWKIGGTNQAARDMLSIDEPIYGRLFGRCWDDSGFTFRAASVHKVWEPEIAIELARDLIPNDAPFDAAQIEAATASLRPAIEIAGTCLDPWLEAGAPSLIADNGIHGHWVTGDPVTDWSGMDLMKSPITLSVNGEVREGAGQAVDGGCFGAAAWLANRLAAHGDHLKAGQLISTGTVTAPPPVAAGQRVIADFGPLGIISAESLP